MPPLEFLLPVAFAALVLGALIGWLARGGQVRRHADDAQAVKLQLATAQTTAARVPQLRSAWPRPSATATCCWPRRRACRPWPSG